MDASGRARRIFGEWRQVWCGHVLLRQNTAPSQYGLRELSPLQVYVLIALILNLLSRALLQTRRPYDPQTIRAERDFVRLPPCFRIAQANTRLARLPSPRHARDRRLRISGLRTESDSPRGAAAPSRTPRQQFNRRHQGLDSPTPWRGGCHDVHAATPFYDTVVLYDREHGRLSMRMLANHELGRILPRLTQDTTALAPIIRRRLSSLSSFYCSSKPLLSSG